MPVTTHGLRATFKDWSEETTGHANKVIERSLAHRTKDKAERAYERGQLLPKRRRLMEDWANFLDGQTAEVIPLKRA